jgi:hypothetical protein
LQETQEKRRREQQTTTTTTTTNNIQDDQKENVRQEYFSEKRYNRTERQTRHRSPSESSDISTSHGVVDEEFKKKYLRCLAYMKLIERLYENHQESDEDSHRRLSRRVCHLLFFKSYLFLHHGWHVEVFFSMHEFTLIFIRLFKYQNILFYLFFSRIELFVIDRNMKKLKELYVKLKNEHILLRKLMLNKHVVSEKKLVDLK